MPLDPIQPIKKIDPPETNFQKNVSSGLNNLYAEKIKIETIGKGDIFSAKAAGAGKFLTYGSKIYGANGFDPYRAGGIEGVKSGNDVLYDSKIGALSDFTTRGLPGMYKLAKIGAKDTFGLGMFSNDLDYINFDETMQNYSSSRGGDGSSSTGKFLHNTALSSGYTVGIIAGMAAEEISLGIITAASGLTAAPATGAAAVGSLARGIGLIAKAGNKIGLLNKIDNVADVAKARSWLSKGARGFGKNLLPLGNTADFFRGAEKLKGLSNTQVAVRGVGSLVRDARKFSMANSESKLEADLARKTFTENAYNDHYKYTGGLMSDKLMKEINSDSQKVYDNVYAANFGLIYLTNAITFDGMLSNMKGLNRLGDATGRFSIKGFREGLKKVSVKALPNTLRNVVKSGIRNTAAKFTKKNIIGGAIRSSMEGFQEVGQDIISNSVQSFYQDQEKVRREADKNILKSAAYNKKQQFSGSFYKFMSEDLTKATKDIFSKEGLSTFLSGFFMGAFAHPAGVITGGVQNYLLNPNSTYSLAKSINYLKDNKKFKADKIKNFELLEKQAAELELFFNDTKSFNDVYNNSLFNQVELQEALQQSALDNNKNEFNSAKHEMFTNGVYNLFKTGTDKEFSSHLNYMADNFNVDELADIFPGQDVNENNKSEFQQKLKDNANKISEFREIYDAVNQDYVNEVDMSNAKVEDEDYMAKAHQYRAYENLKKELVFSYSKIQNRTERIKKIKENIAKTKNLNTLESNSFSSSENLQMQIDILETEVNTNNELLKTSKDPAFIKKAKLIKSRFENYKKYQDILNNIKKNGLFFEENVQEEYEKLFNAYEEILKTYTKTELQESLLDANAIQWQNESTFTDIWDTLSLGSENEYYQAVVDTLINPSGQAAFLEAAVQASERLDKNKKEIILSALEAFQKREISDDMLGELSDNNLFFNLDELDDLLDKGLMPINIYNLTTHEIATEDEYNNAVKILDSYVKKLTGKKITNLKSRTQQGRKLKNDNRRLVTLIRNFKIKLDQDLDLNSREGLRFLELLKQSKNLLYADKFLIEQVLENKTSAFKIKFVINNELPVVINKEGVIELDLRFASSDYSSKNSMSFENLVTTGLIQKNLSDALLNNEEVSKKIEDMMIVVKEKFLEKYENIDINALGVFSSPVDFISAALNDMQFQKLLSGIEYENETTVWKDFNANIKNVLQSEFDDNLLTPVINLATIALSKSEIDEVKPAEKEVVEEATNKTDVEYNKDNQEKINKKDELLQQKEKLEADLKKLQDQYDEASNKRKDLNLSLPKEDRDLDKTILDLKKEKEELELKIKNLTDTDTTTDTKADVNNRLEYELNSISQFGDSTKYVSDTTFVQGIFNSREEIENAVKDRYTKLEKEQGKVLTSTNEVKNYNINDLEISIKNQEQFDKLAQEHINILENIVIPNKIKNEEELEIQKKDYINDQEYRLNRIIEINQKEINDYNKQSFLKKLGDSVSFNKKLIKETEEKIILLKNNPVQYIKNELKIIKDFKKEQNNDDDYWLKEENDLKYKLQLFNNELTETKWRTETRNYTLEKIKRLKDNPFEVLAETAGSYFNELFELNFLALTIKVKKLKDISIENKQVENKDQDKVDLLKTLNTELDNKIEQINSLETEFTNKTDKTNNILKDIAELDKKITELLNKISDLNKQIKSITDQLKTINIDEEVEDISEDEVVVEETVEEPIEEPIEELVEEPVVEQVEDEEIKDLTAEELTDKIFNINKEISILESEFKNLSPIKFLAKRRKLEEIDNKKNIKKELQDKLKEYNKKIEQIIADEKEEIDSLLVPEIVEQDELISSKTSWDKIPKSLQIDLAKLYDKSVNDLNQEDIAEIKKLMVSNLDYIKLVNDFNNPKNLNEDIQEIKIEEEQIEEIVNQNDLITTTQPEEIIEEVVTDEEVVIDAKVEIEPVILNTSDLNINSELGKQINDLSQTLLNKSASQSFDIIKPFLDKISVLGINSTEVNALKSHKADYADVLKNAFILYFATKDTTLKDLTDLQLFTISDKINKLFNNNRFIDVALEINNEIYIIRNTNISRDKKLMVVLQKLGQNKTVSYNFNDLSNVSRIIAPGATVDNSINTTINETDMTDLEGSYADIMKNFSNLVDGVDVISDEELLQQLKTELNKCK